MLKSIYIENIILIEKMHLFFKKGMTSITGESGAGKSVILDSLNIALGDRASQNVIRKNSNKSLISIEFDISKNKEILEQLNELGYNSNGELIIKKIINKDTGSKIFINDIPSNIQFVKKITSELIEIHGQMEQASLLNSSNHIIVVDRYSKNESKLIKIKELFLDYKRIFLELEDKTNEYKTKIIKVDELNEMLSDLQEYKIKEGEEMELIEKRSKFLQIEKLIKNIKNIESNIEQLSTTKISIELEKLLINGDKILENEQKNDISNNIKKIDSIAIDIESLKSSISSMFRFFFNSENERLDKIEERIDQIREIARKYRVPSTELFYFVKNIENQILEIDKIKIEIDELNKKLLIAKENYFKNANEISNARKKSAHEISLYVNQILKRIGMEKAVFDIKIETSNEKISENGSDNVTFVAKLNLGMDFMQIDKIASGGEMSRMMLALKSTIGQIFDNGGVIIFDEIESGLSGNICKMVAKELKLMSKNMQIFAITHNSYIAGYADNHFKIHKIHDEKTDLTTTFANELNQEERINEVSSMISGTSTDESRNLSEKILNEKII